MDQEGLISFAASLANEAADLSLAHFRTKIAIESKADRSPVTEIDRGIERVLRQRILERFPDHGIIGEEYGDEKTDASHLWVIDPIDGTRSFITGHPLYGMLLALMEDGKPLMGQIDMPVLKERWIGMAGQATLFNGRIAQTSACQDLENAAIYTTSPDCFTAENWPIFDRLSRLCAERRFGGDCYSYGMLASGFIELIVEDTLHPYDFMALIPVVEGAGGVITDWDGKALSLQSDGGLIAAANPVLHAKALEELLKKSP